MAESKDVDALELKRLTDALHERCVHPDYEYATTKSARKSGESYKPEGEGWEPNIYDDDPHSAWERFDFYEEDYWRRLKPTLDPSSIRIRTAVPDVAAIEAAGGRFIASAARRAECIVCAAVPCQSQTMAFFVGVMVVLTWCEKAKTSGDPVVPEDAWTAAMASLCQKHRIEYEAAARVP
jgi:hypothetical protein